MSFILKLSEPGEFLSIGYRTPGFRNELDVYGKLRLAAELGMEIVEPQYADHDIASREVARDMVRAAAEFNIRIPSMGVLLPLSEPGSRDAVQATLGVALESAQIMGATYVFTASRFPPEDLPQPQAWSLVIDNLRRCADAAQHAGITLGLEPEWFLGSAERVERVIRFVNHPNLRPNFDPTNLYLYGSDPVAAFDRFAPSILSGHIKDGVRRGEKRWEVDVGKGELDYPALFQRILDRGRGINLFIEHCNSSQAVRAAAAHIKKVVDDAFAQSRRTGKE